MGLVSRLHGNRDLVLNARFPVRKRQPSNPRPICSGGLGLLTLAGTGLSRSEMFRFAAVLSLPLYRQSGAVRCKWQGHNPGSKWKI